MRKRTRIALLLAPAGGAVAVFLFAWSGIYSVAASKGHFPITAALLEFVMRSSVERHAIGLNAPPLDEAMFERAIGHFQSSCAPCHGAPGVSFDVAAQHMLPQPPDLSRSVPTWTAEQLFWIVKHGIKYTGMPAWPARNRDDEVWAMVAFLQRLPSMQPEQYASMVAPQAGQHSPAVVDLGASGGTLNCAGCHGLDGLGSKAGGVPALAGQKEEYLSMALEDYASGKRPSGIMQSVADRLKPEQWRRLAAYYASLPGPHASREKSPARSDASVSTLQRGEAIAAIGIPKSGVAACEGCHGPSGTAVGKLQRYPSLAGQHVAYLRQQLVLWRAGHRGGTLAEIMTAVVKNMTDEQIEAVSLYYASVRRKD